MPEPGTAAGTPAANRKRRRLSWIWLVPIIAALGGLVLVVRVWMEAGPVATISFQTAEGLEAGKTQVRYKEVNVGVVERVALNENRSGIIATVRINKDAASLLQEGTVFWVVRPRLTLSGVSGLSTLFSGAYIGVDPSDGFRKEGETRASKSSFVGLETPPVVTTDSSGKQFVLRAADLGSLDIGSPVYYRRVQVGQVVAYQLEPAGRDITLRVFINKPYDELVTADTRFWHASGVDLKLDAGGFKLNTQSLVTMLLGGVAFQAPPNSHVTEAAKENTQFLLAGDQADAMKEPEELAPTLAVLNFEQSVRGLAPGAPVDFRGVVVGQVRSIGIDYVRETKSFRLPVVVELYPSRMGFRERDLADRERARQLMLGLIQRGLRAQLRTGNLLTGQLYVALDFFPNAKAVKPPADTAIAELPTMPGALDELQAKLGSIVGKIEKVPFDEIGQDLRKTVAQLNTTLASADKLVAQLQGDVAPEVLAALQDARRTIQSANGTLSSDAPLQQDTRRMLQELTRTAVSLRTLTDYLERHPEALLRGKTETQR